LFVEAGAERAERSAEQRRNDELGWGERKEGPLAHPLARGGRKWKEGDVERGSASGVIAGGMRGGVGSPRAEVAQ
jgi:hypothetical protein